jgi:hypothetical protein
MFEQEERVSTLGGGGLGSLALMRRLFPLAQDILRETVPSDPRRRRAGEKLRSLRPDEEYARRSLVFASELLNVCDQMSYAVEFLSGFRSRKMPSGEVITRFDYIVYHIENHLIRTNSVLDRVLLLVNIIFQLGVPEKECRFSVIAPNEHIASTPTAGALRAIQKIIEPYQGQRNSVIHRRRLSDENLTPVELYYVFQKSASTGSDDAVDAVTENFFHFYKDMTDKFVKTKKEELLAFNSEAFLAVSKLLQTLEPIFDRNHASLQGNG